MQSAIWTDKSALGIRHSTSVDELTGRRVRIFVASPRDLSEERERVHSVVNFINEHYQCEAYLAPYLWEDDSFGAHTSFQPSIPDTPQFNIVIGLFWSHIGVPDPRLPTMPQVLTSGATAPYDGFHGNEPFPGGAAYEVLTALEAKERTGSPDVYVFRRLDAPMVSVSDRVGLENAHTQWRGVETFFERWFKWRDGTSLRAYESYAATAVQSGPDVFEGLLRQRLPKWMEKCDIPERVWPIEKSPFRGLQTFSDDRIKLLKRIHHQHATLLESAFSLVPVRD